MTVNEKAKQFVDKTISENQTVVFSKEYCPYSAAAKKLVLSYDKSAKILELMDNNHKICTFEFEDEIIKGSDVQDYLAELTGQTTVPNIFINEKHIGGNSDLQALERSGELEKLYA